MCLSNFHKKKKKKGRKKLENVGEKWRKRGETRKKGGGEGKAY